MSLKLKSILQILENFNSEELKEISDESNSIIKRRYDSELNEKRLACFQYLSKIDPNLGKNYFYKCSSLSRVFFKRRDNTADGTFSIGIEDDQLYFHHRNGHEDIITLENIKEVVENNYRRILSMHNTILNFEYLFGGLYLALSKYDADKLKKFCDFVTNVYDNLDHFKSIKKIILTYE